MNESELELHNRLCTVDTWYPIWYKDQRFEFIVSDYTSGYYRRFTLTIAVEKEVPRFFSGTKKVKEKLRSVSGLKFGKKTPFETSRYHERPEYRFGALWPELKTTLDEVMISDVAPNKPFVINCSPEFQV